MVLLTEKMLSGWSESWALRPGGAPHPRRWSGPPFPSRGHTDPRSGSDSGFPASSPVRPGACGWVREVFCPFSVRGGEEARSDSPSPATAMGTGDSGGCLAQPTGVGGLMNMQIEATAGWLTPCHVPPSTSTHAQKSQLIGDPSEMPSLLSLTTDRQSPLKIWGLNYSASSIALASSRELLAAASKSPSEAAPK